MKYKTVQAAHEIRMWTILIATGVIATKKYLSENDVANEKFHNWIDSVKSKFTKKEKEPEKTIKVVIIRDEEH